jgi:hypothetical protein
MDKRCESCGMPVDVGPYCLHCVDENGQLQSFDERLGRLTDYILARSAGIGRDGAERQARAYMRTMPAWRGHPELAK